MDLALLQQTLREFAAERDWQPFHTPKNLAMALMVETAELAEIFQWMTPEQSLAAHGDKVVQERIGDEVADVLLYLLQVADHCAIDLKRAVGRKLVKNARKHPPTRTGIPTGPMLLDAQTHVLVDWENVQPKDEDIRALVPDVTSVWIFHGRHQNRVDRNQQSFGERLTLVEVTRPGKNALDFHLSFYMGYIASRNPDARFVVISNDQGYSPMLDHAKDLGFAAQLVGFGGRGAPRGGRRSAAKAPARTPAKAPAPSRRAAARKTPATRALPELVAPADGVEAPVAAPAPAAASAPARKRTARGRAAVAAPAEAAPVVSAVAEAPAKPAAKKPARKTAKKTVAAAAEPIVEAMAEVAGATEAPTPRKKATARTASAKTAAKAPAKTSAKTPAKKTAAAKAPKAAEPAPAVFTDKEYAHVVATLRKSRDKPGRQARLHSMVRSLLRGGQADDAAVQAVVARLQDEGYVAIDAKGAVVVNG